ncbi:MAG TPA: HAMP domain-containing histidine kinase [Candidatus Ruminococcus avistercoris]|nr:HAMP domain-containing histidine kinase [Candidatus Ruminococcus avistercoris]
MDQRKRKRIALAAGLFFLAFLAGIVLTVKAARQNYESTARQMAALAEEIPESEAVFAGILGGKDTPGKSDQTKKGKELLAKYGYHFADSLRLGALPGYAGGMALILAAGLLGCAAFSWYGWKKQKSARAQAEYLEEKLKEEKIRNQQMENALRREEQETKALITDISHQLKTPVASLKMSYEIVDSTELSREEAREFQEKEREDVDRLARLLEAFTQMSKLETGMIRLCPQKASLQKTLAKAVAGVYVKAMEKGISIETQEFDDILICHDPGWTAEAFANVLDNGVKYAPSGTRITIRVTKMASLVMVEMEDEGPGIPAKERNRIFQRFYRGESESVRRKEGSGVGLYLTRQILERQGGTVCVKNGGNGGSNFVMTLPKR